MGQGCSRVFFDITMMGQPAGRLEILLRGDICPRTAANFQLLCTGEKGLTYKGTSFFKIFSRELICGGDVENDDGTGGKSVLNEDGTFPDENFTLLHDRAGVLSMASTGPNTYNSKFYITLGAQPHLDGQNVAFGQVIEGMALLVQISEMGQASDGSIRSGDPLVDVAISDCGVLPFKPDERDQLRGHCVGSGKQRRESDFLATLPEAQPEIDTTGEFEVVVHTNRRGQLAETPLAEVGPRQCVIA